MNDNKQGPGADTFRLEVVELLTTFQCGIVDLTVVREAATDALSAEDGEAIDYVLGMAAVTSANLEQLVVMSDDTAAPGADVVDRFMSDARKFATTLREACRELVGQGVCHAL